jgi:hypothetical protein
VVSTMRQRLKEGHREGEGLVAGSHGHRGNDAPQPFLLSDSWTVGHSPKWEFNSHKGPFFDSSTVEEPK